MLLINLFGAPCSGKSTLGLYLTGFLKNRGLDAEYAPEYIKTLIAMGNESFNDLDLLANQYKQIEAFYKKADVVVTDSPILNASLYCRDEDIKEALSNLSLILHNRFNSLNILLKPCRTNELYKNSLRLHDWAASNELYETCFKTLMKYDLELEVMGINDVGLKEICERVILSLVTEHLEWQQKKKSNHIWHTGSR